MSHHRATAPDGPRPPLSVVIPAVHGDHGLGVQVEAAREQTLAVGGEVVVALADAAELPDRRPGVRVVEVTGGDILAVRAAGVAAARGDIVAVTEDHAIVAPDWAPKSLEAHGRHPAAAVVGGPVDNGSPHRLLDWASHLMNFGPFMPPITADQRGRAPAVANLSLKREALPPHGLARGELEFELLPRLAEEGRVSYDLAPRVVHDKPAGYLRTPWLHFQNGRLSSGVASAGLPWAERRRDLGRRRVRQLLGDAVLTVRSKPLPWRARASLPLLLVISCAHLAGEWVGAILGPGPSADLLET